MDIGGRCGGGNALEHGELTGRQHASGSLSMRWAEGDLAIHPPTAPDVESRRWTGIGRAHAATAGSAL